MHTYFWGTILYKYHGVLREKVLDNPIKHANTLQSIKPIKYRYDVGKRALALVLLDRKLSWHKEGLANFFA